MKNTQVGIPSPNPSYPSTVNVVKGDNEVKIENKNIFDSTKYTTTSNVQVLNNAEGTLELKGINGYYAGVLQNFKVRANQQYSLSYIAEKIDASIDSSVYVRIRDTGSITDLKTGNTTGLTTLTFTPTTNSIEVYFRVNNATNTGHSKFSNIQLALGTDNTYVPHAEQVYPISLGSIELAKIGSYQDKIFKAIEGDVVYDSLSSTQKEGLTSGKWYKGADIIKKVVTSSYLDSLNMFVLQSINSYGIANFLIQDVPPSASERYLDQIGLSNYFSKQTSSIADTQTEGILYQPRNEFIRIKSSTASTTQELKTYVDSLNSNGNPLVIYRSLREPTFTEITDTTLIEQLENWRNSKSYNGQTNISQTNEDKAFVISYTTLKDVYAELDSRLKALEG